MMLFVSMEQVSCASERRIVNLYPYGRLGVLLVMRGDFVVTWLGRSFLVWMCVCSRRNLVCCCNLCVVTRGERMHK